MPVSATPFIIMAKPSGPVCNLDCRYCYYLGKTRLFPAGERFHMTTDVLETYVRSFIEASPGPVVHFVWHGGEPTLLGAGFYRNALEFQTRYLPPGWTCINNLQTNGVLLDDEWCAFLAERRFHVGISIDGPARLHDACRTDKAGRPTHELVVRALRLLQRHGIQPDVLCTLNAVTAPHAVEVYRFFLDHGVRWLQFLPVVQRTADGGVSDWSVTPDALGTFVCTVFDEWIRHDVGRIAVQTFEECLQVWMGEPASLCIMAETCGRVLAMADGGEGYAIADLDLAELERVLVRPLRRSRSSTRGRVDRRTRGADRRAPAGHLWQRQARPAATLLPGLSGPLRLQRRLPQRSVRVRSRWRARPQLSLRRLPALL